MTREEAIAYWELRSKHIHNWLEENEDVDFIGEYVEAIDTAIEALQDNAEESVTLYATPKATYIRPLTEEIAIEFLQDSGWLPNHDKEIGNPSMVVRCKDCRHYVENGNGNGNMVCLENGDGFEPNDFCSYGERSEHTMEGNE